MPSYETNNLGTRPYKPLDGQDSCLWLRLYDLAGRPIYARGEDGRAGQHQFTWDGRDDAGGRVAPGLYILEILVEGDVGEEKAQEIISVAY